jgi:hypothetical protein
MILEHISQGLSVLIGPNIIVLPKDDQSGLLDVLMSTAGKSFVEISLKLW